eukprot:COSAG02_NODE_1158_length_14185_cov_21.954778_6_plen_184_part_00
MVKSPRVVRTTARGAHEDQWRSVSRVRATAVVPECHCTTGHSLKRGQFSYRYGPAPAARRAPAGAPRAGGRAGLDHAGSLAYRATTYSISPARQPAPAGAGVTTAYRSVVDQGIKRWLIKHHFNHQNFLESTVGLRLCGARVMGVGGLPAGFHPRTRGSFWVTALGVAGAGRERQGEHGRNFR